MIKIAILWLAICMIVGFYVGKFVPWLALKGVETFWVFAIVLILPITFYLIAPNLAWWAFIQEIKEARK